MKILILDFLRRWKWLFVIALLVSIASSVAGLPFVFAPAAVIALLLDAQRGVFRAVRPLPVTRLEQARTWWFVGVPLLPLLSVPVLAIGVILFQQFNPLGNPRFLKPVTPSEIAVPLPLEAQPRLEIPPQSVPHFAAPIATFSKAPAPWFSASIQAWVALGYAGFCFFLLQWAPTRPPENLAENVQQGLFGLLWGISMPGVAFLLPNLPRTPAAIVGWHWAIFVAAPVFVALSYFSAEELVQRRMLVTTVKARPQADAQPGTVVGGLTGLPLYVLNFAGRIGLILIAIAGIQTVVMRWMLGALGAHGSNVPANNPALVMQVVMMGLLMGGMMTEAIGMRGLRVLPLSTPRLAVLLSLISWTAALTCAAFAALWCRMGDPALPLWMNFAAYALVMCGWATLALAALLHIASTARIFVLMLFVMIPSVTLSFLQAHTAIFAVVGVVSGVAGFALLVRGLKKSAAFYRPRGFFGMTPGQPSAVR